MSDQDKDFEQASELITEAFRLFDQSTGNTPRIATARAALMIHSAQAAATLMLVREQRAANLLAAAYAPETLQVDPTLTRAAYQEAVDLLGLLENEQAPTMDRMTAEQLFDLLTKDDPADKDVTE